MVRHIEEGKKIISIDESGFQQTKYGDYAWTRKGVQTRRNYYEPNKNVTLICALSITGKLYYCLLKGSNNQWTFSRYLEMLETQLTKETPEWRRDTILLLDNATIHDAPHTLKTIADLKLPVEYTGQASFNAVPIESVFMYLKKRYSAIH